MAGLLAWLILDFFVLATDPTQVWIITLGGHSAHLAYPLCTNNLYHLETSNTHIVSGCVCVCVCVWVAGYVCVCMFVCLESVCLSVRPSTVSPSICLSVSGLSACPSVRPQSVRLFICLSRVCLPVHRSVRCPPAYPSLCLSVSVTVCVCVCVWIYYYRYNKI